MWGQCAPTVVATKDGAESKLVLLCPAPASLCTRSPAATSSAGDSPPGPSEKRRIRLTLCQAPWLSGRHTVFLPAFEMA